METTDPYDKNPHIHDYYYTKRSVLLLYVPTLLAIEKQDAPLAMYYTAAFVAGIMNHWAQLPEWSILDRWFLHLTLPYLVLTSVRTKTGIIAVTLITIVAFVIYHYLRYEQNNLLDHELFNLLHSLMHVMYAIGGTLIVYERDRTRQLAARSKLV